MHPAPQCRLDSEIAGMLCKLPFGAFHIPGLTGTGQNTLDAEHDSNRFVCNGPSGPDPRLQGHRPLCWFKEATAEEDPGGTPFEQSRPAIDQLSLQKNPDVLAVLGADNDLLPWLINETVG